MVKEKGDTSLFIPVCHIHRLTDFYLLNLKSFSNVLRPFSSTLPFSFFLIVFLFLSVNTLNYPMKMKRMLIKSILQSLRLDPSHACEQSAWMDIVNRIETINKGIQHVIIQRKRFLCSCGFFFCLIAFWILSNIFSHGLYFQRKAVNTMGFICWFENVLLCLSRKFHSDFNIKICVYINDSYAALICGFCKDIFSNMLTEIFLYLDT